MKVMVLGVRGIPNVQGGVETHAEQLYKRLATLGCDVEVLVRTPFVPRGKCSFGPIKLRRIWAPRRAGVEALMHSLLAVLYAGMARPDILHIHAVGPAIVTPLARLLGLRVVVTHHGPDYDRDKWGYFARWVLRTGERLGMRYSHARIAISSVIVELIRSRYGLESTRIPNGVAIANPRAETDYVRRCGLEPGRYFLQVSRMVPEKRQLDLIAAYAACCASGWKLALVGGLESSSYSKAVEAAAADNDGVILTGFLSGTSLEQLYSHAGGFVLPSSHEGLPIALLEALSYGLPVIASNIPANLEMGLNSSSYFALGDTALLADRLTSLACAGTDEAANEARRKWVTQNYDWNHIAEHTLNLYNKMLAKRL